MPTTPNPVQVPDPLLTLAQTAERLNMAEATLRWLRHCGRAPRAAVIGRRVMFRASEVEQWIEEQFAATSRPA